MNKAWKPYLFIFATSLIAHGVLALVYGIHRTRDFSTIYDPVAIGIAEWVQGAGGFPGNFHVTELFHINYMLFVSMVYLVFGNGNYPALIVLQVLLSSCVCLCVFHFLKRHCESEAVAVIFTLATFLFFDNMFMTIVGSPESLYRSIFLVAFLVLIHLHCKQRHCAFLATAIISFVVLLGIRIDTFILFIPVYLLCLKALRDKLGFTKPSLLAISTALIIFPVVFSISTKAAGLSHPVFLLDQEFYVEGIVIPNIGADGKIEPLEPGDRSRASVSFERVLRLFILRGYQFLNIVPPTWSSEHQLYYALHMSVFYLLALAGIARAWHRRNFSLLLITLFYASSILLHGLTRVDEAHRTNFISLIFLIMLSGYGFDFLYGIFRKRWRNGRYRGAVSPPEGDPPLSDLVGP